MFAAAKARAIRWQCAICCKKFNVVLSPEERRILELRNEGSDWASIASELGGSAESLRRKLSRALDRVAEQLGLDDVP